MIISAIIPDVKVNHEFHNSTHSVRVNFSFISFVTQTDLLVQQAISYFRFGWPTMAKASEFKQFRQRKKAVKVGSEYLVLFTRVIIPKGLMVMVLHQLHE